MRTKCLVILLIGVLFYATSCKNNSFNDVLFRTMEDPFYDIPTVDSLTQEETIFVKWREDQACDCFYLQRSKDQSVLNFECIYTGLDTHYTDTALEEGQRYIYRLDKCRGKKMFIGKDYEYGFSSYIRKDEYEENDTEEKATNLNNDLECNLTCVKYITNSIERIDTDWMYVDLPAMRKAEITLAQKGLGSGELNTKLVVTVNGNMPEAVKQSNSILIENPTYEQKKIYFNVSPNTTALFNENEFIATIIYNISLKNITKY